MIDVRGRLTAPDLPELVQRLGFRGEDEPAVLEAAAAAAGNPADVARVAALAERLLARIGDFTFDGVPNPVDDEDADAAHFGVGVLPLLALLVTAVDVSAFHASRGISAEISWRSLSDLGQQAWVHRMTYGGFGLHTAGWMRIAWSGALYWLGRLQFNLQQNEGVWVLSTHIPNAGPLTPESVDDSFRWARTFFAEHFPECPSTDFYCSSWLLDPQLVQVLPAESNMVRFQQRWRLYGEPMPGNDDVLFFAFFRRGPVDLRTLPRDTTLQRAIIDKIAAGGHWNACEGRIPQDSIASPAAQERERG